MTELPEFVTLNIDHIRESKTNPRRHFEEESLKELADSIKSHGILVPLLVRLTIDGQYEIIAGARRYRAAKTAGLRTVPVRIRNVSDAEMLEIQVVENLQREDVHPLDEAEGYRVLMERTKQDIDAIAAKVGKSISYVYQRLKLAELIEPAKKAFWNKRITSGHAILIARLATNAQKNALNYISSDGRVTSVRNLADYIRQRILLDLHSVPWKKDDETLVRGAGPCSTCPKRTGNCAKLFLT